MSLGIRPLEVPIRLTAQDTAQVKSQARDVASALAALQSDVKILDTEAARKGLKDIKPELENLKRSLALLKNEGGDLEAVIGDIGNNSPFPELSDQVQDARDDVQDLSQEFEKQARAQQRIAQFGELMGNLADKTQAYRQSLVDARAITGLTGDDIERVGRLGELAFKAKIADNLADATQKAAQFQNILGGVLDQKGLEDFIRTGAAVERLFGTDLTETASKARTVIKAFGLDGEQAANIVALGMQKAGNAQNDYLDTLDEYGPLVKDAGFTIDEFVGKIVTGMEAGARNTDKLADAIKETGIRARAGDISTALKGITSPINGQISQIVKLAETGQITISQLLQQSSRVIDEAFTSGNITDSIRQQLQVALSGSPAEDLGTEIYSKVFSAPIDNAAVQRAGETARRQLEAAVAPNTLGEKLGKELEVLYTKAQATFGGLTAFGADFLKTTNEIGPGVASIGTVFDQLRKGGSLAELGAGIKSGLLPVLEKVGIVKKLNAAAEVTEAAATALNTTAKEAQTAATAQATVAQYGLNTAMLANPVFLLIAGVGLLTGAILLFTGGTKDLGEATADAKSSVEDYQQIMADTSAIDEQTKASDKLIAKYEELKKSRDPSKEEELRKVTEELAQSQADAATPVDILNDKGEKIGQTWEIATDKLRTYNEEQRKQNELAREDALKQMDDNARGLVDSYQAAQEAIVDLRDRRDALETGTGGGDFLDFKGKFDQSFNSVASLNEELGDTRKKIEESEPALRTMIDQYQKAGLSVDQIAARLKAPVELVVKFGARLGDSVISSERLESAIASLDPSQQAALRTAASFGEAYELARQKVNDLAEKIQQRQVLHLDTKELEKELAAAKSDAEQKQIDLQAHIKTPDGKSILEGVPEKTQADLGKLTDIVNESVRDAETTAATSRIGEILGESAKIKSNLDENGEIQKLVENYKSASSEIERDDLAAKIAAKVPSAITGYNRLTGAVQIGVQAAEQYADANAKAFGADLQANQQALAEQITKLGESLAEDEAAAIRLEQAIARSGGQGPEVEKLRSSYAGVKDKIAETEKQLGKTIVTGQKFGLIKQPVSQYARALGLSDRAAQGVDRSVQKIKGSTEDARAEAAGLAEQFTNMRNANEQIVRDAESALALLILQERQGQIDAATLAAGQAQYVKIVQQAKGQTKEYQSALSAAQRILGTGERIQRDIGATQDTLFAKRMKQLDEENQALDDQAKLKEEQLTAQLLASGRTEQSAQEQIDAEQRKLKLLEDQLANIRRLFNAQANLETGVLTVGIRVTKDDADARKTLQKTFTDLRTAIAQQSNQITAVKLKLGITFDEEEVRRQTEKQLRTAVEAGTRSRADLDEFLRTDVTRLKTEFDKVTAKLLQEAEANRTLFADDAQFLARQNQIIAGLANEQVEITDKINERLKELNNAAREHEAASRERFWELETRRIERAIAAQDAIVNRAKDLGTKYGESALTRQKEAELARIEQLNEAGLLTEADYQRRQAEQERLFTERQAVLAERARGVELELERQAGEQRMQLQLRQLQEQMALAEKYGQAQQAETLRTQISDLTDDIGANASILTSLATDLQGNLTEVFSNLFTGDAESVREPFKKMFAELSGALQTLAATKITEAVLSLPMPGILGVLAAIAAKPLITALINSILGPLLTQIASFATGGRFDEPTLALIGDASRLGGGTDREWLLRDDQFRFAMRAAASSVGEGVVSELRLVRQEVSMVNSRFKVSGRDIRAIGGRAAHDGSRRATSRQTVASGSWTLGISGIKVY